MKSEVRELPQTASNILACPPIWKNTCVGTKLEDGETQVSKKESTLEDVISMLVIVNKQVVALENMTKRVTSRGKDDPSCVLQGIMIKFNTLNEQSVSNILSLCAFNDSLSCVDNIIVKSVHTLVNLIDD